ncbi:RRQRL motif-containing zinc-binding protein [Nocardia sp. NPDC002869]|uniref:RRQRL motif-containing zinc-binding protein n=1 Tax=Nocardia sp. NPDC002869 TaxID=3161032 RepID=UPI00398D53D4
MSAEQQYRAEVPVYSWRCAPDHLRTRRQLAADGLRPNGQDIAGVVERPRLRGEPLTAYLYDIRLAAAKRKASPAQLEALQRATRERQMRAAERRGVDRAELATEFDPGPAWSAGNAFAGLSANAFAAGLERKGLSR